MRVGPFIDGLFKETTSPDEWSVLCFDPESGELLSVMQSDKLGQMRTGAASGVARVKPSLVVDASSSWMARMALVGRRRAICGWRASAPSSPVKIDPLRP